MISAITLAVSILLMVPRRQPAEVNPVPGELLREAFAAPLAEPLPADMARLSRRIASPLRLVGRER